jgi:hypothetical protein
MPSEITFDHVRQARMGWTTRLVESFLEQLSCHQVFMDVDIIPEAWTSRKIARCEHRERESVVEPSSK